MELGCHQAQDMGRVIFLRALGMVFMASRSWGQALLLPATKSSSGHQQQRAALSAVAILLLLLLSPSSTCPVACSCSLEKVNCTDCQLHFVPAHLPAMVTTILLDCNHIIALQNRTFMAQKALHRLSLRSNILTSIHRRALVGLGKLQELDLSENCLRILHPETFLPVPNLRVLKLGRNKLLRLEPELLAALPHLQVLSVQGNALATLSPGIFEAMPSLGNLSLLDNPWSCSCGIQPLFHWLMENTEKVPEANSVSCQHPAHLAHHPIAALGNNSFAHCQERWARPQNNIFLLLIGPSTFLASLCVCMLVGSLAVARLKLLTATYLWLWALKSHARNPQH